MALDMAKLTMMGQAVAEDTMVVVVGRAAARLPPRAAVADRLL